MSRIKMLLEEPMDFVEEERWIAEDLFAPPDDPALDAQPSCRRGTTIPAERLIDIDPRGAFKCPPHEPGPAKRAEQPLARGIPRARSVALRGANKPG